MDGLILLNLSVKERKERMRKNGVIGLGLRFRV